MPRGKKKNVSKRFSTFRVRGFEAGVARVYWRLLPCVLCQDAVLSLCVCLSFFLSFFLIQFPLQRLRLGSTGGGYRVVPPCASVAYFTRRRRRTVLTSRTGGPLDTRLRLSSLPRRRRRRMGQMRRPTTRLQRRRRPGGRRRCSTPDTTRGARVERKYAVSDQTHGLEEYDFTP